MDTVKSANELKLEAGFKDSDTRTITLSNPRSNVTAADINSLANQFASSQPIVGDKGGSEFLRFNKAKIIQKQTTYLDLRNI